MYVCMYVCMYVYRIPLFSHFQCRKEKQCVDLCSMKNLLIHWPKFFFLVLKKGGASQKHPVKDVVSKYLQKVPADRRPDRALGVKCGESLQSKLSSTYRGLSSLRSAFWESRLCFCIFLAYTYETPFFFARMDPTQWDHKSLISWGTSW